MRIISLLFLLLLALPIAALGQKKTVKCDGPYEGVRLTKEVIKTVLEKHSKW